MKKFLIFSLLLAAIAYAILRKSPANPLESYVYRLRTRRQLEAHSVCVYCGAKAETAWWREGFPGAFSFYHGEMISLCWDCWYCRIWLALGLG